MNKISPPPYKIERLRDYPFSLMILAADGGLVAECCRGDSIEDQANALLFISAPGAIKALKRITSYSTTQEANESDSEERIAKEHDEMIEAARLALAPTKVALK